MSRPCKLLASSSFILASSSRPKSCLKEPLLRLSASNSALVSKSSKRQRLLYTSPPLRATIVTSAAAHSSTASSLGSPSELQSPELVNLKSNTDLNASQTAELVQAPTKDDLEEAELDAEVLPSSECKFIIHDQAAEQLRRISTRENDSNVALRISVESGGCHGYQYKLVLSSLADRQPEDYVFSHRTIRPSNVLIDAVSLPLMKGSRLDFVTELIGSSFRVDDNPQAKGSGCGCGVSWELKL